jgi:hypothetical protein
MRMLLGIAAAAALLFVVACDDGESDEDSGSSEEQSASFDEGTIRMDIEFLDTGLLKGRSYVNAADGWSVEGVDVTAVLDDGTEWGVIEIPEEGDADWITFFEVQVQELPRGDQVALTTSATFVGGGGTTVERTVTDKWPP